jgi:Fe2+ or Zn2+ uptake regulation protein
MRLLIIATLLQFTANLYYSSNMSDPSQQFSQQLKKAGYSLTKSREMVFAALQDTEPQTMAELVAACPGINRTSIYRSVTLFEELGIVQRLQMGWKYKLELTDSFVHHHHHLSCVNCGIVIALPEDDILEARLQTLAQAANFQAQDHQLEIRGLCQNCQQIALETAANSN